MMTMTIMDNKSSIIMIDNKISGRRCVRKMNNLDMIVSNHITKAASCFWSLSGFIKIMNPSLPHDLKRFLNIIFVLPYFKWI